MNRHSRLLPSRLLSAQLLGTAPSGSQTAPTRPAYVLGNPGRPAPTPTLLIADSDNSGSVAWPAGHDPLSNRFAEVERALHVVAGKGLPREQAAVLHFDDVPSSGEVGPVPITKHGLAQLQAGLHVPPDSSGSSRLGPSLRRAHQLAEAHDGQTTLVVLSDFELLDPDPPAVLRDLVAFPGTVHAVVLGGGTAVDHLADRGVILTKIKRGDPPGAVAKALFASLTRYRPGSRAFREHHAGTTRRSSHIPQQPAADISSHPNSPS